MVESFCASVIIKFSSSHFNLRQANNIKKKIERPVVNSVLGVGWRQYMDSASSVAPSYMALLGGREAHSVLLSPTQADRNEHWLVPRCGFFGMLLWGSSLLQNPFDGMAFLSRPKNWAMSMSWLHKECEVDEWNPISRTKKIYKKKINVLCLRRGHKI